MTLKNTDKDAIITIKNLQTMDGESEITELITEGKFYIHNEKQYIFYEEDSEESHSTVMMVITDKDVTLTRKGEFGSKMYYQEGKTEQIIYHTPYGDMIMALKTLRIDNHLENGGELRLTYELSVNEEFFHNDLTISVRKRKDDNE